MEIDTFSWNWLKKNLEKPSKLFEFLVWSMSESSHLPELNINYTVCNNWKKTYFAYASFNTYKGYSITEEGDNNKLSRNVYQSPFSASQDALCHWIMCHWVQWDIFQFQASRHPGTNLLRSLLYPTDHVAKASCVTR